MKPNLRPFDRLIRFLLGAFFLFAAWVLFEHPLTRVLSTIAGVYTLLECLTSSCPLYGRLGMKSQADTLKTESLYLLGLFGVQIALAYKWLSAGLEKVSGPDFVADLVKTLAYSASKNPFPWYRDILTGFATRYVVPLGYAIEWGEVAAGAILILSVVVYLHSKNAETRRGLLILSVAALLGGALLNTAFYLAVGWIGPSTKNINVVMFWTQLVLAYVWLSALMAKKRT